MERENAALVGLLTTSENARRLAEHQLAGALAEVRRLELAAATAREERAAEAKEAARDIVALKTAMQGQARLVKELRSRVDSGE